MENIPVFKEVAPKETAYNTAVSGYNAADNALGEAQTKYKAAETAQENAQIKRNAAFNIAAPYQKAYGEALTARDRAKDVYDNFPADKKYKRDLIGYTYTGYQESYREYTAFYDAMDPTITTVTAETPVMFCGFFIASAYGEDTEYIVFVTGDDEEKAKKMRDAVTTDIGVNKIKWYKGADADVNAAPKAITPKTLHFGDNYDEGLNSFIIREGNTKFSPEYGRLYYYDYYSGANGTGTFFPECDKLKYGTATSGFLGTSKSISLAFKKAYEHSNMKRMYPNLNDPIYKDTEEETDEYLQAKKDWENKETALSTAEDALAKPAADLKEAEDALTEANTALATAKTKLTEAESKKAEALNTLISAVSALNAAATDIAIKDGDKLQYKTVLEYIDENKETQKIEVLIYEKPYTTIGLSQSIILSSENLSTTTNAYFWETWDEGYTLDGNGYYIQSSKPLFATNKGTIENLANLGGSIARKNQGDVYYCLTRIPHGYRTYDGEGTSKNYTDETTDDADKPLSDVMYALRSAGYPFGYDAETETFKRAVEPADKSKYKLYAGKYTNNTNTKKEPASFKFNISDSSLKINPSTLNEMVTDERDINENAIVYIENNDAIGTGIENVKNIAIKGKNTTSPYTCNNTELTDEDNARKFYIPMDFIAKKVTYGRSFNQKYAAVCFPFTLTTTMQEKLGIDAAYQFKEVKEGVMWFSLLDEAPANQPCLIVFKDENFEEDNIPGNIFNKYAGTSSFSFVSTPDELVATDTHGEKTFYGTYKLSTVKGLLGNNSTDAIYGIQKGELVKMTKDDIKFKAFRGYVRTPKVSTTAGAPSFKIGLMDEDGNELSTAIETVSGEIISGFKAKGGDNAIEIITDKACQVKVYALNGALVKSTRVEAGVTSLPVKAGMYVVNGAKVIVK